MKSNLIKAGLFLGLLFLINKAAWADVRLPALIGDNMVLQREVQISIWGWADPGEKVSLQFLGTEKTVKTGKDGKWSMVLSRLPAGGPYKMVIRGKNTITVNNILVGDVWLASGQSNMEWILKNINNAEEEIKTADNPQIRLFFVEHKTAFQPQNDVDSRGWKECTPDLAANFSAIAYLFGRELFETYKVPIGLISSSWGGTPAESWTSIEGLKNLQAFYEDAVSISNVSNAEFETLNKDRKDWYLENDSKDRGFLPDRQTWAEADLNTTDWGTFEFPGLWFREKDIRGYGGTIWFRKEISLTGAPGGQPLELHFSSILVSDSTYFNGRLVGYGSGYGRERVYKVPANLVKPGRNVITIRIKGAPGFGGGIMGTPDQMFALSGDIAIPLSGDWKYKTGPDISSFPDIPGLEGYNATMPNVPVVIYNGMIAPLVPYKIKGVIWYQGESNADNMEEAMQYYSLFPAMINDWRKRWGCDFPFLFVQLAGYQPDNPQPSDYPWAHLREAQSETLTLPNTGMAVAIDIGDENNIHPKNKQDVAHRLVLAARKVAYNENIVYSGPTLKGIKVEGNKIRVSFNNLGSGLWVKDQDGSLRGFSIAGADMNFVWARAFLEGNDVIVLSERVREPVAVRYDWGNTPDGNLYNRDNLPAVPFRTDNR